MGDARLTVVGCSGSVSGPDSPASSYLIEAAGPNGTFSVLLDCGPGSLGALYRYRDPADIDAVALSHLHPDHCLDLTGFYVATRYGPGPARPHPVPVYGPPGTLRRIARAYDPGPDRTDDEALDDLDTVFTERVWQSEQQLGPFTVTTAPMAHPVPCLGTRFTQAGRSLVYSGDTGPTDALVALAEGAELLLCEAAFDEPSAGAEANPPGVHLTGTEAGRIAAEAHVGRLVLTHIPPWSDPQKVRAAAAAAFDGPIDLATSGWTTSW